MVNLCVDERPFGACAAGLMDRAILALTRQLPASWFGLKLAMALRRLTISRLGNNGLDTEVLGLRLRLYPRGNGCEKGLLFTPAMFEPLERRVLAEKIAAARAKERPFVFVDIGANVGLFSLIVAQLADGQARVLAIEPQPGIKERLAYNIAANPGLDIRQVAVALADRNGEVDLFIDGRDRGGSRIGGRGDINSECVRVCARRLADILTEEGFEGADVLKIDVEGAEDLVLGPFLREAADAALPQTILIEDSRALWSLDLFELMARRGYVAGPRSTQNMFFERIC